MISPSAACSLVKSLMTEAARDALRDFSSADAALLVRTATATINSPGCKPTTRGKLARLLSAVPSQKMAEFER
jgi:hypothetical protein